MLGTGSLRQAHPKRHCKRTFQVAARSPSFSGMPWKAMRLSCFRLMVPAASSSSKRLCRSLWDGLLPEEAC